MLFIRVASLFVVLFGTLPRGFAKVGQINYFWLVGKGVLGEIFVYLVNLARKQCIHVNNARNISSIFREISRSAQNSPRVWENCECSLISRYEKNPTLIFCARPPDPIFDGSGTRTKDIFDARLRRVSEICLVRVIWVCWKWLGRSVGTKKSEKNAKKPSKVSFAILRSSFAAFNDTILNWISDACSEILRVISVYDL